MADDKNWVDQTLDLFVYGPLGAALAIREQLPSLAERGRRQFESQVMLARMMGQMAVSEGQRNAKRYTDRLADVLNGMAPQQPSAPSEPAAPETPTAPPASTSATNGKRTMTGDHLAIPGYDTLSASQVVQRLAGLDTAELEAVREYEEANRGRRTILSRIAQLQSS